MKTDIGAIVLATDLLPGSERTLSFAILLARKLGARLVIASALELGYDALNVERLDRRPSLTRLNAELRMKSYVAKSERAALVTASALLEGSVPEVILDAVRTFNADLVVVGTPHVPKRLEHFLIGSNTEALILRSPCPTLTIGPNVPACTDTDCDCHFKRLIYISNFRGSAQSAFGQHHRPLSSGKRC